MARHYRSRLSEYTPPRRRSHLGLIFGLGFIYLYVCWNLGQRPKTTTYSETIEGIIFKIIVVAPQKIDAEELTEKFTTEINKTYQQLLRNTPDSFFNKFNQLNLGQSLEIPTDKPIILHAIKTINQLYQITNGAFDIRLLPENHQAQTTTNTAISSLPFTLINKGDTQFLQRKEHPISIDPIALVLAIDYNLPILQEEKINGIYIQFGKQRLIFGSINPPDSYSNLVIPLSSDNTPELLLTLHDNAMGTIIKNSQKNKDSEHRSKIFTQSEKRAFNPYVIGPSLTFAAALATVFARHTPQQAIELANTIPQYTLIAVEESGNSQVSELSENIAIIPKNQ